MRILPLATTLCLCAAAMAQTCGTLTITGTGAGGTDLTVSLSGAPLALAVVGVSQAAGTTSIPFGTVTLDLGIAMPFVPYTLGLTNAAGSASQTFHLPPNVPTADVFVQGVTASFALPPNFSLSFCTSNVVSQHIG